MSAVGNTRPASCRDVHSFGLICKKDPPIYAGPPSLLCRTSLPFMQNLPPIYAEPPSNLCRTSLQFMQDLPPIYAGPPPIYAGPPSNLCRTSLYCHTDRATKERRSVSVTGRRTAILPPKTMPTFHRTPTKVFLYTRSKILLSAQQKFYILTQLFNNHILMSRPTNRVKPKSIYHSYLFSKETLYILFLSLQLLHSDFNKQMCPKEHAIFYVFNSFHVFFR
mgnify:CR=1 FL=1